MLADNGIAALLVDNFKPRGISEDMPYALKIMGTSEFDAVADAYAALKALNKHPAIDGWRIGVMGFSQRRNCGTHEPGCAHSATSWRLSSSPLPCMWTLRAVLCAASHAKPRVRSLSFRAGRMHRMIWWFVRSRKNPA
jgi:hypothetical protein